jgi:glutathione synthase/RimK-type ligase-like ATP-grasp enzyme
MYGDTREEHIVPLGRFLARVVREFAEAHGWEFMLLSGDWVMSIQRNGVRKYIFGYDFGLNNSAAKLIARDKAATIDVLRLDNIPAVEHKLFLRPDTLGANPRGNWQAITDWFDVCNEDVVCKPNIGSAGQGVMRATNAAALERIVQKLFSEERAIAISPFVNIEAEYRATILDDEVLLVYEKVRTNKDDIRFNLVNGAFAKAVDDEDTLAHVEELATRAARAIGIRFANVDIIRHDDAFEVLEVNSGVMFEHYAEQGDIEEANARAVYEKALSKVMEG